VCSQMQYGVADVRSGSGFTWGVAAAMPLGELAGIATLIS